MKADEDLNSADKMNVGERIEYACDPVTIMSTAEKKRRKRQRFFKKEAQRTLCDGNYMTVLFISVFVMLTTGAVKYLFGRFFDILDEVVFSDLSIHKSDWYIYFSSYIGDVAYVLLMSPLIAGAYTLCASFTKRRSGVRLSVPIM